MNLAMTPEITHKNFKNTLKPSSIKINNLHLKKGLRRSTISPKRMNITSEYWMNKSLNKTKERLEKARKFREGIFIDSHLFLKNKHQVEEALGGND